jgi:hypothetical protein
MLRFFSKFNITVEGGKDEDKINSSIHFFILCFFPIESPFLLILKLPSQGGKKG